MSDRLAQIRRVRFPRGSRARGGISLAIPAAQRESEVSRRGPDGGARHARGPRLSGLHKVYRMGEVDVRALDGVDFELRSGELLVLLGASGSGKSTLLNILGGLDVASSGHVSFEGQ